MEYNQLTLEIIAEIQAVSEHVLMNDDISEDYARDEMPIYGAHMPEMVVQPRSTEEVAAVMKICYEHTIPVTPRGAGTGLAGGAVPLLGGVLIDLSKMNRIKKYDLENFVVEIEAGVLLNDLAADCLSHGMMYPPDPGEKFACVGGNVATNAGGMRAVKYGVTRDYVRAMTVEQLAELLVDSGAIDVLVADTPAKMKDVWAARSSFLEAIMAETKLLDVCDVVVPVNQIAAFLEFVNTVGAEHGLVIKSFGHAGDGNLHIYQCSNELLEEKFKARVDQFFETIYQKVDECGGLVSGEHGIGSGKIKYLKESVGSVNMELMEGIKRVFDPKMILNPGKVCTCL